MQRKKAEIMDEGAMRRALTRIAYQIIERNHGAKDVLLAGVRTRGLPLADRIADKIGEVEGFRPPVIALDISSCATMCRGTAARPSPSPTCRVWKTVRSSWSMMCCIRAHRTRSHGCHLPNGTGWPHPTGRYDRPWPPELPIRPDYVGKNLPTAQSERVQVCLHEIDGVDAVRILEEKP